MKRKTTDQKKSLQRISNIELYQKYTKNSKSSIIK